MNSLGFYLSEIILYIYFWRFFSWIQNSLLTFYFCFQFFKFVLSSHLFLVRSCPSFLCICLSILCFSLWWFYLLFIFGFQQVGYTSRYVFLCMGFTEPVESVLMSSINNGYFLVAVSSSVISFVSYSLTYPLLLGVQLHVY